MSDLSFRLSRAVSGGRRDRGRPATREVVLARLLAKRAAAQRAGLAEAEAIMRSQIEWSLPMQQGEAESADPA